MRPRIKKYKVPFLHQDHIDISYLNKPRRHTYKSIPGDKGLQSRGEKFNFVVDWEIQVEKDVEIIK